MRGIAGCRRARRAGWLAWPVCSPPWVCGGSGCKAGRQAVAQRCAAALHPEGQARTLRGTRQEENSGGEAASVKGLSGCGLLQYLIERPGGGAPAQGLAGPGVQLRGDRVQLVLAVH